MNLLKNKLNKLKEKIDWKNFLKDYLQAIITYRPLTIIVTTYFISVGLLFKIFFVPYWFVILFAIITHIAMVKSLHKMGWNDEKYKIRYKETYVLDKPKGQWDK